MTATLRELHPEVCDALRLAAGSVAGDSNAMLAYLRRQDLFITETVEGVLRYHHIFQNFLGQQSPADHRNQWHRAAADHFLANKNPEGAIYHLVEAQAWDDVADLLESYAPALLSMGRLDTLSTYIDC